MIRQLKFYNILKILFFLWFLNLTACNAGSSVGAQSSTLIPLNPDATYYGHLNLKLDENNVYTGDKVVATITLESAINVKNLNIMVSAANPDLIKFGETSCTIVDSLKNNSCLIHFTAQNDGHVTLFAKSNQVESLSSKVEFDITDYVPQDIVYLGHLVVQLNESQIYTGDKVVATITLESAINVKNLNIMVSAANPDLIKFGETSCTIVDSFKNNSCLIHFTAQNDGHVTLFAKSNQVESLSSKVEFDITDYVPQDIVYLGHLVVQLNESQIYTGDKVVATITLESAINVKNLNIMVSAANPDLIKFGETSCTIVDSLKNNSCLIHFTAQNDGHVTLFAKSNQVESLSSKVEFDITDYLPTEIVIPGTLSFSIDNHYLRSGDTANVNIQLNNSHNVKNLKVMLLAKDSSIIDSTNHSCIIANSSDENFCNITITALKTGTTQLVASDNLYGLTVNSGDINVANKIYFATKNGEIYQNNTRIISITPFSQYSDIILQINDYGKLYAAFDKGIFTLDDDHFNSIVTTDSAPNRACSDCEITQMILYGNSLYYAAGFKQSTTFNRLTLSPLNKSPDKLFECSDAFTSFSIQKESGVKLYFSTWNQGVYSTAFDQFGNLSVPVTFNQLNGSAAIKDAILKFQNNYLFSFNGIIIYEYNGTLFTQLKISGVSLSGVFNTVLVQDNQIYASMFHDIYLGTKQNGSIIFTKITANIADNDSYFTVLKFINNNLYAGNSKGKIFKFNSDGSWTDLGVGNGNAILDFVITN